MTSQHQSTDKSIEDTELQELNKTINTLPPKVAYIVGGSILVGALLISASIFYNFHLALKDLGNWAAPLKQNTVAMGAPGSAATVPTQAPAPTTPAAPVNIKLNPNTPYLGNANAKVTVVEFADYECPFCEQWFKNTWPDIKAKYVDTGKIKFVYQDFAFLGPDSNTAAEAAHCAADQNMFWQYHDYLFNNQGAEGSGWAAASHETQFAQAVGLNMAQFNQCFSGGKYKQEVLDETAAGKSYGVNGTPSIFVNGSILVGAQPATVFERAIDAALNK